MMHFPHLPVFLVNRADFAGKHEAHRLLARREHVRLHRAGVVVFQSEEAVFGGRQLFAHLFQPAGMRQVARADDADAFQLRPFMQVLKGQVAARSAGKVGVNVKIGDELHDLVSNVSDTSKSV